MLLQQDKLLVLCDSILVNHENADVLYESLKTCKNKYVSQATEFISFLGEDDYLALTKDKAWVDAGTEPFHCLFINSRKPIIRNLATRYKTLWTMTHEYLNLRQRLPPSIHHASEAKRVIEFDSLVTSSPTHHWELLPRIHEDEVYEPDLDIKQAIANRLMYEKQIELITFLQEVCSDQGKIGMIVVKDPANQEYCFETLTEKYKKFPRGSKIILKGGSSLWSVMYFIEMLQAYAVKQNLRFVYALPAEMMIDTPKNEQIQFTFIM